MHKLEKVQHFQCYGSLMNKNYKGSQTDVDWNLINQFSDENNCVFLVLKIDYGQLSFRVQKKQ